MAEQGGEPFLRIEHVSKSFGTFKAVVDVSLTVGKGEIFSLLGGSGCGKTTLLRMLAGFEEPTAGRIVLDGRDMAGVPPWDRPVHMMFQSYAIFPHMTVEANVGYGLKHEKGLSKAARAARVAEMLDLVQLSDFARRRGAALAMTMDHACLPRGHTVCSARTALSSGHRDCPNWGRRTCPTAVRARPGGPLCTLSQSTRAPAHLTLLIPAVVRRGALRTLQRKLCGA